MTWRDVHDWAITAETTGFVTWIGTILGLFGLCATYVQAHGAKKSAISAKNAVENLEGRTNSSNLGFSCAQIETIKTLVYNDDLSAVQMLFSGVKRASLDLFVILKSQVSASGEIVTAKKNIYSIEYHMNLGIQNNSSYSKMVLTKSLIGLSGFLSEKDSEIRSSGVKKGTAK